MTAQERIAELRKRNQMFLSGGTSNALPHKVEAAPMARVDPSERKRGEIIGSLNSPWRVGDLCKHEGRVWRVGLVTDLRMRLDPVTPKKIQVLDSVFNDFGGSINVSSSSILPRATADDLTTDERRREAKLISAGNKAPDQAIEGKRTMAPVAAPPNDDEEVVEEKPKGRKAAPAPSEVVPNAKRLANKERVERLKSKAAPPPPGATNTKPKAAKQLSECKCGQCGEMVPGHFVQGHDARFKGWLLKVERGQMPVKDLPKKVQDAYEWNKKGDGYIPTRNYKGEPHSGYEKSA